jgi:alpha,alpha-trehalase
LLDDRAGHFSIRPTADARVKRRYVDGSLVLTTTFDTASGTVELTDALAMGEGVRGHDLGLGSRTITLGSSAPRHSRSGLDAGRK